MRSAPISSVVGCAAAFVLSVVPSGVAAQGARVDTIAGRVIAADSTAISSARVSATGEEGRTYHAQTDAQGRYRVVVPSPGRYLLTAAAFGYAPFSADVVIPPDGGSLTRDLRLNPRAVQLDTLTATAGAAALERPRKTPGEESDEWTSLLTENLPVDAGSFADVAAFQDGVLRLGSDELSIAGQPPSQNRTTVDGAGYGGASLPAEGVRSIAVVTNTYDPARGQFSGGLIAARTISGTNLWGGAASAFLDDPALRYGGLSGQGLGDEDRFVRLSAGGGGALVRDRLFVYGSADASRSGGPQPFLDASDAAGLRRLGLAPDSVRRFLEIARGLGLPAEVRATDAERDFASVLGRIDYTLSERHTLTARLHWRGSRASGIGVTPLSLAGQGGELRNRDGGIFAQLASGGGLWSNELRVYRSAGETTQSESLLLPSGRVRVGSTFADGEVGNSTLDFGGGSVLLPERERSLWEVADEVTRESENGEHHFKAGVLLQEEYASISDAGNRFGTFAFNSLTDLENGKPASFTRTLGFDGAVAVQRYGALYAADTWRPSEAFSLIGGVRLEGSRYAGRPALAAAVDPLTRARSAGPPPDLLLSPRAGFTWQVPGRGDVAVRGGVGRFRGTVPLRPLASVWNETGGEEAATRLVCVGPAAPLPQWSAYADPSAIPATCADGSSAFSDSAPAATLFADDFAAPRSWRGSLEVGGRVSDLVFYRLGGVVARGTRLPTAVDRNLDPVAGFALAAEGGRPVFAPVGAIDPITGGIAPDASRLFPALGAVREVAARGESWTAQLTAGFNGLVGTKPQIQVGGFYTLTASRELAGGVPAPGGNISSTAGDPSRLEWGSSPFDQRHTFQLLVSGRLSSALRLSAIGRLGSGLPFTPLVSGDVNGDGFLNDRAFVFDPAEIEDPPVASGMAALLDLAPGPARDCLRAQLGSVADRGSCRTGWSPSLDLLAEVSALGDVRSRRLVVSLTASNVTAGLDYLLHGPDDLRGWGQYPLPDPTLLQVRGFDPERRAFEYQVNPRFGQPLGGGIFRLPFQLTLQARVTVGADPRYQPMAKAIDQGLASFGTPEKMRAQLADRVRNVPGVILALNAEDPGALGLTPAQAERLQAAADSLGPPLDTALDSLASALAQRGPMTAARKAALQERSQEAQALVDTGLGVAREVLTPEQWEKLPHWLIEPPSVDELQSPTFEVTLPAGGP